MIRDSLGDIDYWEEEIIFYDYVISRKKEILKTSSTNTWYEPQYIFEITNTYLELLIALYSKGENIDAMEQYFSPLLDAWEKSEEAGKKVYSKEIQYTRHTWKVNLDHYIKCFWLVGLALVLNISDDLWNRLIALVGNEGEDELLDRIIATRESGRKIGSNLCFPQPYQRLLAAIDAPKDKQPKLLSEFVKHWYKELKQPREKGKRILFNTPYWYTLGDKKLDDSGYFGRWCIEAVAAVKAFNLDDSLCLGMEHYPGDLLRPDGESTHPARTDLLNVEKDKVPISKIQNQKNVMSLGAKLKQIFFGDNK
jgi:hypothetical protein